MWTTVSCFPLSMQRVPFPLDRPSASLSLPPSVFPSSLPPSFTAFFIRITFLVPFILSALHLISTFLLPVHFPHSVFACLLLYFFLVVGEMDGDNWKQDVKLYTVNKRANYLKKSSGYSLYNLHIFCYAVTKYLKY